MRVRKGWQVLQREASGDELERFFFPLHPRSLKLRELLVSCTLLTQDRQIGQRVPCVSFLLSSCFLFGHLFVCLIGCLFVGLFLSLLGWLVDFYTFVCFRSRFILNLNSHAFLHPSPFTSRGNRSPPPPPPPATCLRGLLNWRVGAHFTYLAHGTRRTTSRYLRLSHKMCCQCPQRCLPLLSTKQSRMAYVSSSGSWPRSPVDGSHATFTRQGARATVLAREEKTVRTFRVTTLAINQYNSSCFV